MTAPARVAQSVEQLTRNEQVASSILASGSACHSKSVDRSALGRPRLCVPAYFGPWERDHWERLIADRPSTVVINPDSGPGVYEHDGYGELVEQLSANGTSVLGYVATSYLAKPLDSCVDEAVRYNRWYGVHGIFWDEFPRRNAYRAVRTLHAAALRPAARVAGVRCVFNAGGMVPKGWMLASPGAMWVTFEGSAAAYSERVNDRRADMLHRQCHLVYECADLPPRFPHGLGGAYATSDRLPNPWDVYESVTAARCARR